uniref:Uncharacterized protein n=1 Tax=Anguilla anguilla TaxID=7936 RepID=A0A0E9S7V1_ANGAN
MMTEFKLCAFAALKSTKPAIKLLVSLLA